MIIIIIIIISSASFCLGARRRPERAGQLPGALDFFVFREFKDVAFEDVVFDSNSFDIGATIQTIYNRVTQLLSSNTTYSNAASLNSRVLQRR